jgi:hypothetical protein
VAGVWVVEALECFRDISRHEFFDHAVDVVPGVGYVTVYLGCPVSGDFVVGL